MKHLKQFESISEEQLAADIQDIDDIFKEIADDYLLSKKQTVNNNNVDQGGNGTNWYIIGHPDPDRFTKHLTEIRIGIYLDAQTYAKIYLGEDTKTDSISLFEKRLESIGYKVSIKNHWLPGKGGRCNLIEIYIVE